MLKTYEFEIFLPKRTNQTKTILKRNEQNIEDNFQYQDFFVYWTRKWEMETRFQKWNELDVTRPYY